MEVVSHKRERTAIAVKLIAGVSNRYEEKKGRFSCAAFPHFSLV